MTPGYWGDILPGPCTRLFKQEGEGLGWHEMFPWELGDKSVRIPWWWWTLSSTRGWSLDWLEDFPPEETPGWWWSLPSSFSGTSMSSMSFGHFFWPFLAWLPQRFPWGTEAWYQLAVQDRWLWSPLWCLGMEKSLDVHFESEEMVQSVAWSCRLSQGSQNLQGHEPALVPHLSWGRCPRCGSHKEVWGELSMPRGQKSLRKHQEEFGCKAEHDPVPFTNNQPWCEGMVQWGQMSLGSENPFPLFMGFLWGCTPQLLEFSCPQEHWNRVISKTQSVL